MIFRAWWDQLC